MKFRSFMIHRTFRLLYWSIVLFASGGNILGHNSWWIIQRIYQNQSASSSGFRISTSSWNSRSSSGRKLCERVWHRGSISFFLSKRNIPYNKKYKCELSFQWWVFPCTLAFDKTKHFADIPCIIINLIFSAATRGLWVNNSNFFPKTWNIRQLKLTHL